jgi:hypothetical protein
MTPPTGTPPPLLPGVMRLAVKYGAGNLYGVNVFHFQLHETGGLGSSDVLNMVTALGGFWINDVWKQSASNGASCTDVQAVYALIEGQPNVKRVRIADGTVGQVTNTMDYAQCSFLINWECGDPRRGGKPRTYFYGVTDSSESSPAAVDSAVVAAINTHLATFIGHVEGHTNGALVCDHLIEYSTVTGGAYRTAGHALPISSGSCNPIIATQRRRVDRSRV